MELQNIDYREELNQNIHSMKAPWWMRWGIVSVFIIFTVIIFLGYIVKYPDVISSEFRLKTNKPSVTLPLFKGSQIEKIFNNNGDLVNAGTHLLVLRNSANYEDVFLIEKALDTFSFNKNYIIEFFNEFSNSNLQLGENIENEWNIFSSELLEYYKIEQLKTYKSKIQFVKNELSKQASLKKYYIDIIKGDENLQYLLNEKAEADSTLYSKGVISRIQYNTSKQEYYSKAEALEHNVLALKRINLDIVKLQNTIKNYGNDEKTYLLEKEIGIRKSLNKLKSSISTWKASYVLTSPIKGEITFIQDIKEGVFYDGNTITIIPEDKEFYATVKIPFAGAGKVKKGQRIILKLNDYPYREYGVVNGNLLELSEVAGENHYLGKISINSSKKSSYEKDIIIKENMSGISEIITNDRSILGRIFERLLYAFNQ